MDFSYSLQHSPDAAPIFIAILVAFSILMSPIVLVVRVLIYCKIFARAGYCWALGLLVLVPIANIIMPFVLAFGDWPVLRELRLLRQQSQKPNQ
jgi:hypothetical protein